MRLFLRPRLLLLFTAPVLLLLSACLRSRVHITSEPTGAEVIWRGQPYGATPVTIPFLWYWYYDFTLEKPGFQRKEVVERFRTPPWFLFPFDLLMEIIPIPIPDNRYRHYALTPRQPGEASLLQAEGMGIQNQIGITTSTLTLPTSPANVSPDLSNP